MIEIGIGMKLADGCGSRESRDREGVNQNGIIFYRTGTFHSVLGIIRGNGIGYRSLGVCSADKEGLNGNISVS